MSISFQRKGCKRRPSAFRAISEPLEGRRLLSVSLVHPGSDGSNTYTTDTVEYQGDLYSVGWDSDHGTELWKSDGTPQGSSIVKDITPGTDSTPISSIQVLDGLIYFIVKSTSNKELWRSDGTDAGTFQLLSTSAGSMGDQLLQVGNEVYFVATKNDQGQLWQTDGTVNGTEPINPNQDGSLLVDSMASFGGTVYFTAFVREGSSSNYYNIVLCRIDNTPTGTSIVHQFSDAVYAGQYNNDFPEATLISVGSSLYFNDPANNDLWSTQGTPQTTALAALSIGGKSRSATSLNPVPQWMEFKGQLLVYDQTLGWLITDGTTATQLPNVKNDATTDGTYIYSSGVSSGPNYEEFWRNDGTPTGDTLLARIAPVNETQPYHDAKFFASHEGVLYFTLINGTDPSYYVHSELWGVGDTPDDGYMVDEIDAGNPAEFNGELYFVSQNSDPLPVLNDYTSIPPQFVQRTTSFSSLDATIGTLRGIVNNPYATSPSLQRMAGVTIFLDLNSNGVLDAGEPSVVTDVNGEFSIGDVAPGQYTLGLIGPSETWRFFGSDSSGKLKPTTITVPLKSNQTQIESLEIADTSPAIIAGNVFRDLNGNNNFDPSEGRAGFVVFEDSNYNGILDPGELQTTAGADGNYRLAFDSGGIHPVQVEPVKGWDVGQYNSPKYTYVTAVPGQTVLQNLRVRKMATISGVYFDDRNDDGIREKDEPLLPGQAIRVDVFPESGQYTTWVVKADQNGHYTANLPIEGLAVEGLPGKGRRVTSDGHYGTPKEGESISFDVGSTDRARISGDIVVDKDISGDWFKDSTALQGWRVYIDTNRDGRFEKGEPSTITTSSFSSTWAASYEFSGLKPGTYSIQLVLPDSGNFKIETAPPRRLTVGPGAVGSADIAVTESWSIVGTVFRDLNASKKLDATEKGFAGVKVFLDNHGDGKLHPDDPFVFTDSSGKYAFSHLLGDGKSVACVPPDGWRTRPEISVAPSSSAGVAKYNIWCQGIGKIAGYVFDDLNANGTRDKGETSGVGNVWTVWIDLNNDGILDDNEPSTSVSNPYYPLNYYSHYALEHVPPGTYEVRIAIHKKPGSYIPTAPLALQVKVLPLQITTDANFGFTIDR